MDWYVVVKTINGRRYFYRQKTYRDGARVRTINQYIGPATAVPVGTPLQLPLGLEKCGEANSPRPSVTPAKTGAFDGEKAESAFQRIMGPKSASWGHHWRTDRRDPSLVKRNARAEQILRLHAVKWSHSSTGCFYDPRTDTVNIPPLRSFIDLNGQSATSAYYVVVFHEVVHWTATRVPRTTGRLYGGVDYAREELVAELGAVMLMEHLGLDLGVPERHAYYFQHWLDEAGDDRAAILARARIQAEKAVKYVLHAL